MDREAAHDEVSAGPVAHEQVGGRYRALVYALHDARCPRMTLTFAQIEGFVGRLPRGACMEATWWSNVARPGSRHRHVHAWLDAGYHVESVDLHAQTVTFAVTAAVSRRPSSPRAPRQRRIYLDLSVAMYAALTDAARQQQVPRNALVHRILVAWLDAEHQGATGTGEGRS